MSEIKVFNPSPDRARGGLVEIRVGKKPVPLLQQPFVVKNEKDNVLEAQYDIVDPDDRTRDTLVILLKDEIQPGKTAKLRIEAAASPPPPPYEPGLADPRTVIEKDERGVKLINHLLDVYFSLVPDQVKGGDYYAGAATSVVWSQELMPGYIQRTELLDIFNFNIEEHDLQKRCMQVDLVQLFHPATDPDPVQTDGLTQKPYSVVTTIQGPLRATVTVASAPFPYQYRDPLAKADAKPVTLQCTLRRALSIYRDDAIMEQVYVRGVAKGGHAVDLHFIARFFAYMDMGRECCPTHYAHIPDWLSIGCSWTPPAHGYGFCTDVHATPLQSPHPDWVAPLGDHTFSWWLDYSRGATCLHMFKLDISPELLAHETGKAWYFRVYQPLQGTFV